MRVFLFAAAVAAAGAPVSSSFSAGAAVPPPPSVEAGPLQVPETAPAPAVAAEPAGRAVIDKVVQLQGRELTLCLVRSGSAGMAVLSVPENSVVPSLPEISETEFLELVTGASGCRADGEVREVASQRGTIAISAGLDCTAAAS